MHYKEWNALVTLVGQVAIGVWFYRGAATHPEAYELLAGVAGKILWAIGYAIVLNIAGIILVSILVAIFSGRELKDERSDERDWAVGARSMRNAYLVLSLGALATVIAWASGADPISAAFVLFGAMMLGGAADAASRLFYYRVG